MVVIRKKQEELEKICSLLLGQNTEILGQNKLLWN
jgi:hypothetical protein